MHKKLTWNLSVLEHLKQFNENNKPIKLFENVKLDDIKNNSDLHDFIKEVFIQFSKYYQCETIKMNYNEIGLEKSKENIDQIDDDQLIFDYRICLEKKKNKIPDTETDKNLFYMFDNEE